jgi:16S rRNA (cytosine967-C5)-methyltransferase
MFVATCSLELSKTNNSGDMTENDNSFSQSGQRLALAWMTRYLRSPAKASDIREAEGGESDDRQAERRARRLHSACLRNLRLYREMLSPLVAKQPSPEVEAAMLLALAETDIDSGARTPAIIDSWVGAARKIGGKKTAGFANAVLRKASIQLKSARNGEISLPPAILQSHPSWLVKRWMKTLGPLETERMLSWNQGTPSVYASGLPNNPVADGLEKTKWPNFWRLTKGISSGIREALAAGTLTIRDPATRIAENLLCAENPRKILDLCASPGGKSRAILSRPDSPTCLIAADREERLTELRKNLVPWKDRASTQAIDLSAPSSIPLEWNGDFDGVLLDAPCTNTGVIHRKPDVKWRLTPADMAKMPEIQKAFLQIASRFVRPGGTLVYSTCSIEEEENRGVADAFLHSDAGAPFALTAAIRALPSRTGHDGAGVYRFIRAKDR